jgi:transaldolase
MAIYIDSAVVSEVQQAKDTGWVRGVTTNPILIKRAGLPVEAALEQLARIGIGPLYYQLVSKDSDSMLAEAETARRIVGDSLVLKIPPVEAGFRFVAQYGQVYMCCITALFSPAQALAAQEAGARAIAVYVNRATQRMGDGLGMVQEIAKTLAGGTTKILAASIKSAEEGCAALTAGAHHLTLPFNVLQTVTNHPLSSEAVAQFDLEGAGLNVRR